MANTFTGEQTVVAAGLGTWTRNAVGTAGLVLASAVATEVPTSGVILTIAQTGSTSVSVSSATPTAGQNIISLQQLFNCAIGDVITVTIASSTPIDEQLNTVKTTISVVRVH